MWLRILSCTGMREQNPAINETEKSNHAQNKITIAWSSEEKKIIHRKLSNRGTTPLVFAGLRRIARKLWLALFRYTVTFVGTPQTA